MIRWCCEKVQSVGDLLVLWEFLTGTLSTAEQPSPVDFTSAPSESR